MAAREQTTNQTPPLVLQALIRVLGPSPRNGLRLEEAALGRFLSEIDQLATKPDAAESLKAVLDYVLGLKVRGGADEIVDRILRSMGPRVGPIIQILREGRLSAASSTAVERAKRIRATFAKFSGQPDARGASAPIQGPSVSVRDLVHSMHKPESLRTLLRVPKDSRKQGANRASGRGDLPD